MKIGEIWRLKRHHETSLIKYAKENDSRMLAVIIKINILYDSSGEMVIVTECKDTGIIIKRSRKEFIDTYVRVYEEG